MGIISHPLLVLSAFASELYLKCLITIETNETPDGHDLERLFARLQVPTRHEIDGLWDTDIRSPEKREVIDQIRQMSHGANLRLDLR